MKIMIAITIFFIGFFSLNAQAEQFPLCSLIYKNKAKAKAESLSNYDKFKHCYVSCYLARRCPSLDVMELGIIKELVDIVGPGNAEFADLQADRDGVKLGDQLRGANDEACEKACKGIYPDNSAARINCH